MARAICIRTCFHNKRIFEPGESYELAPNEKLDNPNFEVKKDEADKKKSEPEPKKEAEEPSPKASGGK